MKWILSFLVLALPVFAGRDWSSGSSQLGVTTITPISPPLTMAAWFRASNITSNHVIIALNTTTNIYEVVTISANGSTAGDPVVSSLVDASNSVKPTISGGSFSASTWVHVATVLASSTSRILYVNGTQVASTNASYTVDGFDNVYLGTRQYNGAYTAYAVGTIAEAAVWDAALTASEILSLSRGAAPIIMRPASLKFYAPLTGRETTTEWNLVGSAVSLTNAPTASSQHPNIYYP